MRRAKSCQKQEEHLELRIEALDAYNSFNPFIVNTARIRESCYLAGLIHGLRWARGDKVVEPSIFIPFISKETQK